MKNRIERSFWDFPNQILQRMHSCGVLCTVADKQGHANVLTLGWGQIGPFYRNNPVIIIAVTPLRHSWKFLEDWPEFVIAVPDDEHIEAAKICGIKSGRNEDKFAAAGLTPVKSEYVMAPSILECPVNIECRIYTRISPPHLLLTPEHRMAPLERQHTIYFAEVLGTFSWE